MFYLSLIIFKTLQRCQAAFVKVTFVLNSEVYLLRFAARRCWLRKSYWKIFIKN